MDIADVMMMVVILAGAGGILYRSLVSKKGTCAGCASCACRKSKGMKEEV